MNMRTKISTDSASPVLLPDQVDHRGQMLAKAYCDLEPNVCDLTQLARLAELQLHRAIGDLRYENDVCVEIPDTEEAELAILAVSLLAKKVQELKQEWYSRYDAAI